MNVRDFECRSYAEAAWLLDGRGHRKVASHTSLGLDSGRAIALFLYGYKIVLFDPVGPTQIWSRGSRTVTTKNRINRCLPYGTKLYQDKGEWFLADSNRGTTLPFSEGMGVIDTSGEED